MTIEPRNQPSPELGRLLSALAEEPVATVSEARGLSREARMVERIDAELATLVRARRIARRRGYVSLAAAAVVLLAAGALVSRRAPPAWVIERESLPRVPTRVPKVEPSPPAIVAQPEAQPASRQRRAELPRVDTQEARPSPQAEPQPSPSEAPNSTLARENQLFREAAEAARQGDIERALSGFDDLFRDHPKSPLAQTALVRRFRLLEKIGRADEARRDALRYLEASPSGFASGEARALLSATSDAGSLGEAEH